MLIAAFQPMSAPPAPRAKKPRKMKLFGAFIRMNGQGMRSAGGLCE